VTPGESKTQRAESAQQISPGWRSTQSVRRNPGSQMIQRLSPERVAQPVSPFQGSYQLAHNPQGSGATFGGDAPPWADLRARDARRAFSAGTESQDVQSDSAGSYSDF